jgi:hypothetical protein
MRNYKQKAQILVHIIGRNQEAVQETFINGNKTKYI